MYFYVDESGNTGNNLFDLEQPSLFYGLISSPKNLDVVLERPLSTLREKLGVKRLHANELGNKGLVTIVDEVIDLQKRHDIRFDMYKIVKQDQAAICFFDQVFDSAMNKAVPWSSYWTPLRYVLLLKVAHLFDVDTLKKAWAARIELNDQKSIRLLVEVCQTLRARVDYLPDKRSREVIADALVWAEKYPEKIEYNAYAKEGVLQISPNLIGFQQVMAGIARKTISTGKEAKAIVIDQQCEFNKAQKSLADKYGSFRGIEFSRPPGMPEPDYSGMPQISPSFVPGEKSSGLEIVDIYLWTTKRYMELKPLASPLHQLLYNQRHRPYR
jgi:hypothetical protein